MKLNIYYRTSTLRQWSLLLIASVVFTLMAQAHDNQTLNIKKDYLLIINTYTSDAPWSNAIIEPVQKLLSNERGVATFVEHLNMLIINDTVQFDMLKHAVLDKYSAKAPKAILLLGNPSLLLKDELRNRWGDVPLVLCAEEDYFGSDMAYIKRYPIRLEERVPLSTLADKYNLTVLQTKMFPLDNVDLLQRMIPAMEEVLLIGDGRYMNQQLNYDMERLMAQKYPS